MSQVTAVISYDLIKIQGFHEKFKELMKKRKWIFQYGDEPLPNTTCYGSFASGTTEKEAVDIAKTSLKAIETELRKEDKTFKIERYYIVAFPTPPSEVGMFST